jgi:hypothetical protein
MACSGTALAFLFLTVFGVLLNRQVLSQDFNFWWIMRFIGRLFATGSCQRWVLGDFRGTYHVLILHWICLDGKVKVYYNLSVFSIPICIRTGNLELGEISTVQVIFCFSISTMRKTTITIFFKIGYKLTKIDAGTSNSNRRPKENIENNKYVVLYVIMDSRNARYS